MNDKEEFPIAQRYLDHESFEVKDRNTWVHVGKYKGKNVAMVVGAGSPHCAVRVEHLRQYFGVRTVIRIATCGGLQKGQKQGDVILPTAAIRQEGTSACYIEGNWPAGADFVLNRHIAIVSPRTISPTTLASYGRPMAGSWKTTQRYPSTVRTESSV
jgi:uridine phosphorylase